MKSRLKTVLPGFMTRCLERVALEYFDGYSAKSYSQEGEDMIVRQLLKDVEAGFYVDVGAHHPKRFSNTYYFYKKGWSGINIDAMPGSMRLFSRVRPRDINIEAAVANGKKELLFYIFNEPALNTFDEKLALEYSNENHPVINKELITTRTLTEILKENLPKNQKIHFMSIDVEGLDLEVLKSNDWNMYRPSYLLIETHYTDIDDVTDSELYKFVINNGYKMISKTILTLFFKSNY